MQILSKKRFQFGSGSTKFVTAGGLVIETAPDWIAKDPLYALAAADGDITVIQSAPSTSGASISEKNETANAEVVSDTKTQTVKSETSEKGVSRKGN